jgi:Fe-S-cluster containining protein
MKQKQEVVKNTENKEWWRAGVQFQCQGSGKCCTSHGEFGYVFLSPEDRVRIAQILNMRVSEFTKKYCEKTGGVWHLIEEKGKPDCLFLEGNRCGIYEARPSQCRTWPFWPEVMNAKAWQKDVVEFCPGVGKGPVIPGEEIEAILNAQIKSEKHLGK